MPCIQLNGAVNLQAQRSRRLSKVPRKFPFAKPTACSLHAGILSLGSGTFWLFGLFVSPQSSKVRQSPFQGSESEANETLRLRPGFRKRNLPPGIIHSQSLLSKGSRKAPGSFHTLTWSLLLLSGQKCSCQSGRDHVADQIV